jgi:hypothetical protein
MMTGVPIWVISNRSAENSSGSRKQPWLAGQHVLEVEDDVLLLGAQTRGQEFHRAHGGEGHQDLASVGCQNVVS